MWSRICEAEPDAFCWEVFRALETELSCESKDESKTKRESKVSKNGRVASKADGPDQRMLWSTVRELFEYEVAVHLNRVLPGAARRFDGFDSLSWHVLSSRTLCRFNRSEDVERHGMERKM